MPVPDTHQRNQSLTTISLITLYYAALPVGGSVTHCTLSCLSLGLVPACNSKMGSRRSPNSVNRVHMTNVNGHTILVQKVKYEGHTANTSLSVCGVYA